MLNEIVFDIETQNSFAEAENDLRKLKVSVVSVYSYATDTYQSFTEDELPKLWPILEKADRIIGYNSEHFDLPVLNNYYVGNLLELPSLDLLKKIKESLGIRLKLADVAEATLDNVSKSADGLQALRWWKEGKIDEIKKYCEQDVKVTKELYDFGRTNNQLFYKNLAGEILPFAVDFSGATEKDKPKNVNYTLPF